MCMNWVVGIAGTKGTSKSVIRLRVINKSLRLCLGPSLMPLSMAMNLPLLQWVHFLFSHNHVSWNFKNVSLTNYQHITCRHKPFHCGNILMVYPFWGNNRADLCGRRAFHLTNCDRGDIALIKIGSISYRVLSLDESNWSLTVARADMSINVRPSILSNKTFDSTQFTPSPTTRILTLYCGCATQFKTQHNWFSCTVKGTVTLNYFSTNVDNKKV